MGRNWGVLWDGAGLRVKGILLSLLALELFGYCIPVICAIDMTVGNVKSYVYTLFYLFLVNLFEWEKTVKQDYDIVAFFVIWMDY